MKPKFHFRQTNHDLLYQDLTMAAFHNLGRNGIEDSATLGVHVSGKGDQRAGTALP